MVANDLSGHPILPICCSRRSLTNYWSNVRIIPEGKITLPCGGIIWFVIPVVFYKLCWFYQLSNTTTTTTTSSAKVVSNRNKFHFADSYNKRIPTQWYKHTGQRSNEHTTYNNIHQDMKRVDQQDATIRCLLLTSVSTCFGHHYAHLQEIKCPVTAFGVLFWFCWMWLVAVVGRCVVGCEQ